MNNTELLTKLSSIARIEIAPEEQQKFAEKIAKVIEWSSHIKTIDTNGLEPMFSPLAYIAHQHVNLREDVITEQNNQQEIIDAAPDSLEGCIAVPKVIET